ncbi:AAA family ATPase [Candidatus Pacearchaeota archaeon]|nr:AAA family ATPase [Candidatus Pacearchaeota archaeon]
MKIKKITLKNIRSYEQSTIDFPDGSLLLAGDVGSGKTTLLLAIEYALFGLQPGQKGSALLRASTNAGEVMLEFEIDGNIVVIERHLKRENKSITNDYSAITLNGDTLECSVTELKSKILSLLGYPGEFIKKNNLLYRYTVYTPQEQMKQIITEDSETRLNVLRHIFGIDKYKRVRENSLIVINSLKEETKVLQGELKSLDFDKARAEVLKERVILLEQNCREKEISFTENISTRKQLEGELQDLEKNIKEKENFEKEVEKTGIIISSKNEQIKSLNKELAEISKSLEVAGIQFNETEYNNSISLLNQERSNLESLQAAYVSTISRITSLEEAKEENEEKKKRIFGMRFCPACLQDVPEPHKHNIINETETKVVQIEKQLVPLKGEIFSLSLSIKNSKQDISRYEKDKLEHEIRKARQSYIEKLRVKKSEMEKSKDELEKDISFLSSHTSSLKENILKFSKYELLYRKKEEELKKAFVTEKNTEILIAELRKEIELTEKEISQLRDVISNKELRGEKLAELASLTDWISNYFSNLINFTEMQILLKLRREFSRIFSKWFHMIGGESFEVQLDENFTPLIMQGEVEMDYSFLSGGERTAVALAYRLALNQTINSVLSQIKTQDIVILDEPTDGFSEAQIERIRDVLQEVTVKQLIIVSHEQKIEGFVDHIIHLRKQGDISEVDYKKDSLKQSNLA